MLGNLGAAQQLLSHSAQYMGLSGYEDSLSAVGAELQAAVGHLGYRWWQRVLSVHPGVLKLLIET